MENIDILHRLGFEKHDAQVYLAMLGGGALTVAEIAKRALLYRPDVYAALPRLVEMGMVAKNVRGKRTMYRAEHPSRIKTVFEHLHADLDDALPELEAEFQTSETRPIVKYLEGVRGIHNFYLDLLQTLAHDDVYYRYGSSNMPGHSRYVPKNFPTMRDKKSLGRFVITDEAEARRKKPALNRSTKTVPQKYELIDFNISQYIYGNKVAFVDYATEAVIIIENKAVADFQKKIFKMTFALL